MKRKLNHLAFKLWCFGLGDVWCANDMDLPIRPVRRTLWRVRGRLLMRAFGWWKWDWNWR